MQPKLNYWWLYYTNWNLILISIYFLLVVGYSFVETVYPVCLPHETTWLKRLVHILFEIAGPNALFITLVDFIILNHDMKFWNIVAHVKFCYIISQYAFFRQFLTYSLTHIHTHIQHTRTLHTHARTFIFAYAVAHDFGVSTHRDISEFTRGNIFITWNELNIPNTL